MVLPPSDLVVEAIKVLNKPIDRDTTGAPGEDRGHVGLPLTPATHLYG